MFEDEEYEGSLLTITAEIVSVEPDGFIIKIYNDETGETFEANSTREYAEYLINSVNKSTMDNFKAVWLPSPLAKKRDIDLIGMQLGMMQKWMEEELEEAQENKLSNDREDIMKYCKEDKDGDIPS